MKHFWLLLCLLPMAVNAADYPAKLDWAQRAQLSVLQSGVIKTIPVQAGELVKAGQNLLALDTRRFQADVQEASADVERLKVSVEEAQRSYDNSMELYDRTVISERDKQRAEVAFAVAKAEYVAAQAALVRTEVALAESQIRAPFAGRVLGIHATLGEVVDNRVAIQPLITLASAKDLIAKAKLSFAQINRLELGQAARVIINGKRYQGQIVGLGFEPLAKSKHYALSVRFTADKPLRKGQTATVSIP